MIKSYNAKRDLLSRINAFGLCSLMMVGSARAESNLKPVVVSMKGSVTASTSEKSPTPVAEHEALEMGSLIATGGASMVLIAVTPGISARVKEKSAIRLKVAEVGTKSRFGEVELLKGKVLCALKKQGTFRQRYRLDMGPQEWAEATGTMWQSGIHENKHNVAVLEGTVIWTCLPLIKEISVAAGSVLLSEYEIKDGVSILVSVRIVNLVEGTITRYFFDGSTPATSPATAEELKQARNVFNDAVGNQLENLKTDERAALLSLLFGANRILTIAGVRPINAPAANSGSGATVTSANPAEATSPITP